MTITFYIALSAAMASLSYIGIKLIRGRRGRHRTTHAAWQAHPDAAPDEPSAGCNHPAEIGVDTLTDLTTEELADAAYEMQMLVTDMYHELRLRYYRDEGLDEVEEFLQRDGGAS